MTAATHVQAFPPRPATVCHPWMLPRSELRTGCSRACWWQRGGRAPPRTSGGAHGWRSLSGRRGRSPRGREPRSSRISQPISQQTTPPTNAQTTMSVASAHTTNPCSSGAFTCRSSIRQRWCAHGDTGQRDASGNSMPPAPEASSLLFSCAPSAEHVRTCVAGRPDLEQLQLPHKISK